MRSIRLSAVYRTRPIQLTGALIAFTATFLSVLQMASLKSKRGSLSRPLTGQRDADVAVRVLHQRDEHAERQPDARLRLIVAAGLGDLQATHENLAARVERIAVDAAADARREPARRAPATPRLEQIGLVRGTARPRRSPFTSTFSGPPSEPTVPRSASSEVASDAAVQLHACRLRAGIGRDALDVAASRCMSRANGGVTP